MSLRRVYEWAVPVVGAGAIVALAATATDLPSPIAVHWGTGGRPDGSGSLTVITVVMSVVVLVIGGAMVAGARRVPEPNGGRLLVAAAHWLTGFGVAVLQLTIAANEGAATWTDAASITGLDLLLVLAVGLPLGGLGWVAAGDLEAVPAETLPAGALPDVAAADASLVWSGATRGRAVVWLLLAAAATNALVWLLVPSDVRLPLLTMVALPLVLLAVFAQARVTVGPAGVRVGMGPLAWPGSRVAYADLEDVTVEVVEPLRYGGWGYRIVPGVRAIVVRRGEGLRLHRRDHSDLVVTVDDARLGAAVIKAHLDRVDAVG